MFEPQTMGVGKNLSVCPVCWAPAALPWVGGCGSHAGPRDSVSAVFSGWAVSVRGRGGACASQWRPADRARPAGGGGVFKGYT